MGFSERLGNAVKPSSGQLSLLDGPQQEPVAHFGAKVVALGLEFTDPRPDLDQIHHDGMLWAQLLALAHGKSPLLSGMLHGFRCQGTMLVKGQKGYMIRPILDEAKAWPSKQQYEADREQYLRPHVADIAGLLKELFEWEAAS